MVLLSGSSLPDAIRDIKDAANGVERDEQGNVIKQQQGSQFSSSQSASSSSSLGCPTLMLVAPDADAICAAQIVKHLLIQSSVDVKIVPVGGYTEVVAQCRNAGAGLRSVIMVNCGGMPDIQSLLWPEYDHDDGDDDFDNPDRWTLPLSAHVFILDCHRPYQHRSVRASDRVTILEYKQIDEQLVPRVGDSDYEDYGEDDDDDDDGSQAEEGSDDSDSDSADGSEVGSDGGSQAEEGEGIAEGGGDDVDAAAAAGSTQKKDRRKDKEQLRQKKKRRRLRRAGDGSDDEYDEDDDDDGSGSGSDSSSGSDDSDADDGNDVDGERELEGEGEGDTGGTGAGRKRKLGREEKRARRREERRKAREEKKRNRTMQEMLEVSSECMHAMCTARNAGDAGGVSQYTAGSAAESLFLLLATTARPSGWVISFMLRQPCPLLRTLLFLTLRRPSGARRAGGIGNTMEAPTTGTQPRLLHTTWPWRCIKTELLRLTRSNAAPYFAFLVPLLLNLCLVCTHRRGPCSATARATTCCGWR